LIIIPVVVLLLAVGGFLGYSKYKKEKEAKALAQKTEKVSIICPLKSFVVNLLDKKGVGKRYLKVTIQLEVEKEENRLVVENHIPQLRDTILLLLSSQTLNEINTMEGKLELKQTLLSRMKQILGDGIVQRIYFTEFVVQ
jgi:flagellar FliL protein